MTTYKIRVPFLCSPVHSTPLLQYLFSDELQLEPFLIFFGQIRSSEVIQESFLNASHSCHSQHKSLMFQHAVHIETWGNMEAKQVTLYNIHVRVTHYFCCSPQRSATNTEDRSTGESKHMAENNKAISCEI